MLFEIPPKTILQLILRQIDTLFLINDTDRTLVNDYFEQALERSERCFSQNPNKYYHCNKETYFNPYHSVQYMTFLYYLSNCIYRVNGNNITSDKLYYLNKTLNGVDLFYTVNMPDHFMAEHPIGSVIGHAKINNGFLFYQNCTVGGFHLPEGRIVYPIIGSDVKLFAGSSIIGDCRIGNHVNIGAGTIVKNQHIPSNSNVFGQSPNLIIKPLKTI